MKEQKKIDMGTSSEASESTSEDETSENEDAGSTENMACERKESRSNKKEAVRSERVKPPTLAEINTLKETRNLFHSNLFRLQVKEMLNEVKVKDKYAKLISNTVENLQIFLRSLESQESKQDIDKLDWLAQHRLHMPLPLDDLGVQQGHSKKPLQFQFIKPNVDAYLVGAAATNSLLGAKMMVDVCITMPAECFQKGDYLNLAYEQKRALYLMYIGQKLPGSKPFKGLQIEHIKFNCHANNPLKPLLEVTPPTFAGEKLCVRLYIAADEQAMALSRFVPWNSNIRGSLFGDAVDASPPATPTYNAGILFDLTMKRNQMHLLDVFATHKNFQEGLVLLKIWLQQRQLMAGYSGFSAHLLAMFIAYLQKQRKLNTNMSSYQVARTVWIQLAQSKWDESGGGISLCSDGDDPKRPVLEQFHTYYDVVFVDVTGYHNICARLSPQLYSRVRQECNIAVDLLNDMSLNSFQSLFMTKCPLYLQFDQLLKIDKDEAIEQILQLHVSSADKQDYVGYSYPQLLKVITSLLRKGLGQRLDSLLPVEEICTAWPVHQPCALQCRTGLHLGLILNPEHAFNILEKGPESAAVNAEEFRKFWGAKAELRRFQDGSITESVVWAAANDTEQCKRRIPRSIVQHLLLEHLQLSAEDLEYVGDDFDVVAGLTAAFKTQLLGERHQDIATNSDAEALALRVVRQFDDLARNLRNLKDLPLEIISIAGISPVFRYCEPNPVLPQARFIEGKLHAPQVQYGVIQLGISGKWPAELDALRALKTAFYLQIARQLEDRFRLRSKVTCDGLLVLKAGYCFSIEIAHTKEVALLKQVKAASGGGITQYVDCVASIALERRHYVLPRVTSALHALYQQHPCFAPAVIIAKRWLYAQLIDDGLWPDECTELLIASQFLRRQAQQPSCSPQTTFLRFLHLIVHSDWRNDMCFINFNNAMDESALSKLEQRFQAERDSFPPLFVATAYDQPHWGNLWTSREKPSALVLARVTLLARDTLRMVHASLRSRIDPFIKAVQIFKASSQGYDLVLQLKAEMVPNTTALEMGSPFTAPARPNWRLPLAGVDFMRDAVRKLREAYGDFAAFFYNPSGGKEIALVWRPEICIEKEFKVTEVNGCTPTATDDSKVHCDKDIFVEDFKFILKDYYLRIDSVNAIMQASQPKIGAAARKRYFSSNTTDIAFNKKPKVKASSSRVHMQLETKTRRVKKGSL